MTAVTTSSAPTITLHPHARNLAGSVFGRLTALRPVGVDKRRHVLWECRCACGETAIIPSLSLTTKNTQSCGCYRRETVRTHGQSGSSPNPTRTWRIWQGMKQRCGNSNNPDYANYGGRGITVCAEWIGSFEVFLADMGPCPSTQHSIDRKDNNGPYSPGNCRWATKAEQEHNKRTNHFITWNGQTFCVTEWAERLSMPLGTLFGRIAKWGPERALSTPWKPRSKRKSIVSEAPNG